MTTHLDVAPARLLTVVEVAEHMKFSKRFVEKQIESGELPVIRVGDTVRIDPADFDNFKQRHRTRGRAKDMDVAAPASEDAAELAEVFDRALAAYMDGDYVEWARQVTESRFPVKVFTAAGFNVIAHMGNQADDSEKFRAIVAEIIRRD